MGRDSRNAATPIIVTELIPEVAAVTERLELIMRHGFRQTRVRLFTSQASSSSEAEAVSFWKTILAPMLPKSDVAYLQSLDGIVGDSALVHVWIRLLLNQQWTRRHPEVGPPALYTLDEVLLVMHDACTAGAAGATNGATGVRMLTARGLWRVEPDVLSAVQP